MMELRVEHLCKRYGENAVLDDISFTARVGVTRLLGPSGIGKTTLLRVLLGLETPDSGTVNGDKFRWTAVFQENRLLEGLDAEENLRFVLGANYNAAAAQALLEELGLGDVGKKKVRDYSGGMQRRLALARALLAPSDALALDEPFTGLDAENREAAMRGAIAPGFLADFVVIDNFDDFNILEVYKKGKLMFDGKTVTPFEAPEIDPHLVKRSHETFHVAHLEATDFIESRPRAVLGMVPGEIVTTDAGYAEKISVEDDILKIAVIERHKNTHHIGIGYIKGYGLKSGAVATSISHDSHNIIVVGANEEDMAAAVNRVVELGGGIVVMDDGKVLGELQLQIAGIMSEAPLIEVNEALENAKEQAFKLGVSRGVDPFMTLSFMALTVIPTLRLTTRGVFDVINQRYV